jgi:hypothetical protein
MMRSEVTTHRGRDAVPMSFYEANKLANYAYQYSWDITRVLIA